MSKRTPKAAAVRDPDVDTSPLAAGETAGDRYRAEIARGISQAAIARAFAVTRQAISQAKRQGEAGVAVRAGKPGRRGPSKAARRGR